VIQSQATRHSLRHTSIAVSAALLLLGSAGCAADGNEAAAEEGEVIPVLVRPVGHLARPSTLSLSGDVEGYRTASVGFIVPGVVASVGPKEGQSVAEGDVLATLDTTEYALNVELAEAQLERAQDEHDRAQQLFAEKGIPENDFNKARTGLRMAKVGAAMARKKLADTRIVAPMSGVIARRTIERGEQSGPGFPIFTIVQTNPVLVRIGVPESEIGRVGVGQTARISVPSLRGRILSGRVQLVGIAADPVSRTYTVKAEVTNPGSVLRPGMIAEVQIESSERIDALTVPAEAILRTAAGVTQLYIYDEGDRRAYARTVEVGAAYGQEVEIRRGVTKEDLVVVGGQHRVREGARVAARVDAPATDSAAAATAAAGTKSPR
jgi:RND family efflux transporter MFP subunit